MENKGKLILTEWTNSKLTKYIDFYIIIITFRKLVIGDLINFQIHYSHFIKKYPIEFSVPLGVYFRAYTRYVRKVSDLIVCENLADFTEARFHDATLNRHMNA